MYMCGVFVLSRIAYWWSRMGGALVRLSHLLSRPEDGLWLMLMADDLKAESTGCHPRRSILFVVVRSVLGVPLSWVKAQGGRRLAWTSYEVQLDSLALGISENRAKWAVGWLDRVARDGMTDIGDFRAALGRLSVVVGALGREEPFLASLFSFVSCHKRGGLQVVPLFVCVVARRLSEHNGRRRTYPSAVSRCTEVEAFRVDANTEGYTIGVGGWLPMRGVDPRISTAYTPWSSVELDKASAP